MKITLNDFTELLKKHDWFYPMADDYKAFTKGEDSMRYLVNIISLQPELENAYLEYKQKMLKRHLGN